MSSEPEPEIKTPPSEAVKTESPRHHWLVVHHAKASGFILGTAAVVMLANALVIFGVLNLSADGYQGNGAEVIAAEVVFFLAGFLVGLAFTLQMWLHSPRARATAIMLSALFGIASFIVWQFVMAIVVI